VDHACKQALSCQQYHDHMEQQTSDSWSLMVEHQILVAQLELSIC